MKGIQEVLFALRAGYSFFYVRSWEQNRDAEALQEAVSTFELNGNKPFNTYLWNMEKNNDEDPNGLLDALDALERGTVLIACNYHWFIKDGSSVNYEVVQKFINRIESYATNNQRRAVIIIGSSQFKDAIPDVLQKDFLPVEMTLPDAEKIEKILDDIVNAASKREGFIPPTDEERQLIVQNSRGMTNREITNAYSYSIIKDEGKLVPMTVGDLQAKEISSTPGCSIGKYNVPEPLGMDQLKLFMKLTLMSKRGIELSKGILLLGPPGTGKTHFAKWVSSLSGLKVIYVEMAELFGGIVGDTEKNVARMIEVIEANAPCIVFIDEIEKGLSGLSKQTNGATTGGDAGLTEKAFAPLLKFMSDGRPQGVYIIATCNNINKMPPEWVRAERWDTAPFYIGLPDEKMREAILAFYCKEYAVKGKPSSMEGWSGAEIKACCRLAAMMESKVEDAERFIIPISKTMKKDIDELNEWAKDRCIPASMPVTGKVSASDRALQF